MRKEQNMKKRISLLLAAAVLFGLGACTARDAGTVMPGENASAFEGVSVEILSAEHTEEKGRILKVQWNNETDYEVLYGEAFEIQRLEGDQWISCNTRENIVFTAIGYFLKPNSKKEESYRVDWAYDISKPGTYRFTSDCHVYDTKEGTECELWAEFTVEAPAREMKINAQYIRTDGYHEGRSYPKTALLSDRDGLETYFAANRNDYYFDEFVSACDQYNGSFFEKYNLLLVLLEEGSGSILHTVRSLEFSDGTLSVRIDRAVPEACTADMAQWHIAIPVEKAYPVQAVRVYLDNNLAWEDKAVVPNISWAAGEYKTPPKLEIIHDGGVLEALRGTSTWNYANGDGTWSCLCMDAMHPLQMEEHLQPVSCGDSHVRLAFESNPDSVSVRCWRDSQWEKTNDPGETVEYRNGNVNLKNGGWIYEVTALWNDDGETYHGTATYVFYMAPAMAYHHSYATEPETVSDPITGWCGNTLTTIHLGGEDFTFMGGESVTLSNILVNLQYDPDKVCDCVTEYWVDTEMGKDYRISLSQAFVRCEKGQATLTQEQVEIIRMIVEWAEKEMKAR